MTRPTLNSQAAALADDSLDRGAQLQNIRQVSTRVRSGSPPGDDLPPDPAPEPVHDHEDSDHEHPENPYGEEPTTRLAEAIMLMTQELQRRETTPRAPGRVKEPDTFDGSEPRKLNNFILLCNLYFRNNPYYADDQAKVTFALSYLRGTALEYFEPSILDSEDAPAWMDHWPAFVRTLRTQFGPIDPTADAEDGIDNLRMRDNQRIVKYNVEFNRLAVQTGWDDSVLRHRYYSGLAERIKDIMGQQGKPATLEAMKALAHSIDSRHWERNREKARSDNKPKSDNKSDANKSEKKANNQSSGSHNHNAKKFSNNNNKQPVKPSSSSASGNASALADKLGKDGKLTPQERQRRFDNKLCLFCGGAGHTVDNCPHCKSSASKAKARAAQTKEKEKESSDSKKV